MGRCGRILPAILAAAVLLSGCAPAASVNNVPEDWEKDAVIYEVNVRQYTQEGTFSAFSEHLQTLKDMGVTVLWFMPIHPISETRRSGTLGSYYSITDYRGVNPEFGTEKDFKALVDKAHEMGLAVMLDWVANHTGWDCAWIEEHPDWYTKDENGNITDPVGMGWPDVADLNYDSREMRTEMIACMKYWVEEFDIDGFRCDYANGVPQSFWEEARQELETVKPLVMLAEDNTNRFLLDQAFDMNYNWELYDVLKEIARGTKTAYFIKECFPARYPEDAYRLNFLDNHDKNSWEETIMAAFGPEALPSMWAVIYTLPGTPLIYTGDEIGLDHNIAFMEKDPIDWESSGVDYRPLLAKLAAIRRENPALHCGSYGGAIQYLDAGKRNVLAFSREWEGNRVTCLFNLSQWEMQVDSSAVFDDGAAVLMHGMGAQEPQTENCPALPEGEITLGPWEFWITVNEEVLTEKEEPIWTVRTAGM